MGRNNKEWEPEPQRQMPDELQIEIPPDDRKDMPKPKGRFEGGPEMGEGVADVTPVDINEEED